MPQSKGGEFKLGHYRNFVAIPKQCVERFSPVGLAEG